MLLDEAERTDEEEEIYEDDDKMHNPLSDDISPI